MSTTKEWYKNNKEESARRKKEWIKTTIPGYLNRKMASKRKQCRMRGIECTITPKQLVEIYNQQRGLCALTGRVLVMGSEATEQNALSLDRINSGWGYVDGNVRLVTAQANAARGLWGDEELLNFCKDVVSHSALV